MFYLMHKDIKVLKFSLYENGNINKVYEIYNIEHMPFSTNICINKNDYSMLKEWWSDRSIPYTRNEYNNIVNNIEDTSLSLVVKANGLSLTDQYWIKDENDNISYDDISFFTNKFNEDLGDLLVGKPLKNQINYYSPDSTSTGNLKKRWKIIDGRRVLLKAGTKPNQYEIFNEIIASKIMTILNIDHVEYSFIKDEDIYCASEDFIKYNEDFVSAYQLKNYKKKPNDEDLFNYLVDIYKDLEISDYKTKINQMLFIDFIAGNIDRHLNNFGVIRDAKTLEFIKVAPIYDTGSCFGYDLTDNQLNHITELDWKPFKTNKIDNQLELIDDFSWLDLESLKILPKETDNILTKYKDYISEGRRESLLHFLIRRINMVYSYLNIDYEVKYNISTELSLKEKKIYDYIKQKQIIVDISPICIKYNYSYITVYRAISGLVEKGLIKRVGSKKTGYWIITE